MKIEKRLISYKNIKEKRTKDEIKYIVVQTIEENKLSHYRIVNGKAIQFIPDTGLSDSVNGARLSFLGHLHGICTKYNSISIGITDNISNDDIQTCYNLIMTLKQRYNIDKKNIVRQLDVTGVSNPEIWQDNNAWEKDIISKLIDFS